MLTKYGLTFSEVQLYRFMRTLMHMHMLCDWGQLSVLE